MDQMVSGRVPKVLLQEVVPMLEANGHTISQLVRSAFKAYRDTGRLPDDAGRLAPGMRTLRGEQASRLRESLLESTRSVPESYFGEQSYEEMLERALRSDYEALA